MSATGLESFVSNLVIALQESLAADLKAVCGIECDKDAERLAAALVGRGWCSRSVYEGQLKKLAEHNRQMLEFSQQWESTARRLQAEKDDLELTVAGIMHSVDKWLESESDLEKPPVTRAVLMRERTLQIVEQLQEQLDQAHSAWGHDQKQLLAALKDIKSIRAIVNREGTAE